jgi:hypothetical protein
MFIAMCPKSILYNVASSGIEAVRCGKFRESLIKNNEVDTIEKVILKMQSAIM